MITIMKGHLSFAELETMYSDFEHLLELHCEPCFNKYAEELQCNFKSCPDFRVVSDYYRAMRFLEKELRKQPTRTTTNHTDC